MQQHDRVYVEESFGNFPSDLFWNDVHSGILSKVKALCHSNFSSKIVIFRSMSFSSDSDAAASLMNRKVKAAESSYNTLGRGSTYVNNSIESKNANYKVWGIIPLSLSSWLFA